MKPFFKATEGKMKQEIVKIQNKEYKWDENNGLESDAVLELEGLIAKYAWKYFFKMSKDKYEFADLQQDGNLGALKACKKFDPDKGAKYSTWAAKWILGEMANQQRTPETISLEEADSENALIYQSYRRAEELAMEYLSMLNKKDQTVLIDYFGLKNHDQHSLKDLAKKYKVTTSVARSLVIKAINKVRRGLNLGISASMTTNSSPIIVAKRHTQCIRTGLSKQM
jgi:RNA polymerase sigma factor (sigma-70 family)